MGGIVQKVRGGLVSAFFVLCLLTTGVMLLIGIFTGDSPVYYVAAGAFLFSVIFALLYYFTKKYEEAITKKRLIILSSVTISVLAMVQLRIGYSLQVTPSWDPGGIYLSVLEYLSLGEVVTHGGYFDRFANNTGLLWIEMAYFGALRAFGIKMEPYQGTILNIVFTDAAIIMMLMLVQKIWGNQKAVIFLALSFMFTPYVLYMPVLYTDTMSMVFITLACYLFACFLEKKKVRQRVILLVSISLCLFAGVKVKGSVIILLIAMLLYVIFNFRIKQVLAICMLLVIPFIGCSQIYERIMEQTLYTDNRDKNQFPLEYWLYLGMDNPGGYSDPIFNEIYNEETLEDKKRAAREGIKKKWEQYTPITFIQHLVIKSEYTFSDGSFYAMGKLKRHPLRDGRMHEYFHLGGDKAVYYKSIADAYKSLIWILLIAGMAVGFKRRRFDLYTMLYTAVFGLTIFLMIWETRSRYLINFTPLMLALAGHTLAVIGDKIGEYFKRNQRE